MVGFPLLLSQKRASQDYSFVCHLPTAAQIVPATVCKSTKVERKVFFPFFLFSLILSFDYIYFNRQSFENKQVNNDHGNSAIHQSECWKHIYILTEDVDLFILINIINYSEAS